MSCDPAYQCNIWLYDGDGQAITALWCRPQGRGQQPWKLDGPTIAPTETYEVALFVCMNRDPDHYWAFRPTDEENPDAPPDVGKEAARFTEPQAFRIRITDGYERHERIAEGTMHRSPRGTFEWRAARPARKFSRKR